MNWSWQDLVAAVILIIFMVRGIKVGAGRPFAESLVAILSLAIVGLLLNILFKPLIKQEKTIEAIIFAFGLIASAIAFKLPGKAVARFIDSLRLGAFKPLLGFIFGSLEALLLIGVVIIILSLIPGLSYMLRFKTVDAFKSVAGFFSGM